MLNDILVGAPSIGADVVYATFSRFLRDRYGLRVTYVEGEVEGVVKFDKLVWEENPRVIERKTESESILPIEYDRFQSLPVGK